MISAQRRPLPTPSGVRSKYVVNSSVDELLFSRLNFGHGGQSVRRLGQGDIVHSLKLDKIIVPTVFFSTKYCVSVDKVHFSAC